MRIDHMQYDNHERPIGIPGYVVCDHGGIRNECELCKRDALITKLRDRLATEREAGERAMWEKMAVLCPHLFTQELDDGEMRHEIVYDCLIIRVSCQFDTCPLRQDADKHP